MRNNGICAGLDGLTSVKGELGGINKEALILLWEVITDIFIEDWDFVDKVYHVGIGNPPFIQHGGYKLTHSDITNLLSAWRLYNYVKDPRHIVEIGGGFGCLTAMLKRLWPRAKFTLIDLKESLRIQRYYLKESFGTLSDFSFKQDMDGIESADLVINIRSMMEMTKAQVDYYINHIQSLSSRGIDDGEYDEDGEWIPEDDPGIYFYCVNRYGKYDVKLREYPFDDDWQIHVSQPLPGQDHVHEYLLQRGPGHFTNQLKTLRL
jgi:hypothetical protein